MGTNWVQPHFELVSSVLTLEATEWVSEPVTQMAVELTNNHLINKMSIKATFFFIKKRQQTNF